MPIKISARTVKREFLERLEKISGQNIHKCFQCGTCSGSCPMNASMDAFPRKVMHLAQLGLEGEVGKLNTCWICASCHACNVKCPRGIDLPRVMEALRLMALRRNVDHINPSRMASDLLRECPQIAMVAAFRKLTS
jgi:heterodisulfide reductase subunit C